MSKHLQLEYIIKFLFKFLPTVLINSFISVPLKLAENSAALTGLFMFISAKDNAIAQHVFLNPFMFIIFTTY